MDPTNEMANANIFLGGIVVILWFAYEVTLYMLFRRVKPKAFFTKRPLVKRLLKFGCQEWGIT